MLAPQGFSCEAAIQRGRLKHSWLENEILNKSPEIVVALRRKVGWPALQRFPADVQQVLALAGDAEAGFSPARLMDECAPLALLPEEQRSVIRKTVHAAYLECFDVHALALHLHNSALDMNKALRPFLDEWNKPDDAVSDAELAVCWRAVLGEAEHLRAALDALPKGIVLP